MKIRVYETGASAWVRTNLGLCKRVCLRTSIGKRDQDIAISYHHGKQGQLHCLFTFHFDFELAPQNLSGQWCDVTLDSIGMEQVGGPFLFNWKDGRTGLASDDPEVHKLFIPRMAVREWWVSIKGCEDVLWQFPIPFDETFEPMFAKLQEDIAG